MNSNANEKNHHIPSHVSITNLAKDGSSSGSSKMQGSPIISPPLNLNPNYYPSGIKSPIPIVSLSSSTRSDRTPNTIHSNLVYNHSSSSLLYSSNPGNNLLSPTYANPSLISLASPTSSAPYQASSISKSLSNLDVKGLTRDISHISDVTPQEDMWPMLVVYVLPLFNGERLGECIETLNEMVRTCLRQTDLASFTDSIQNELLETGMFTLNTKLSGVTEEKLVTRIVELWSFFLGIVLPYLEGVFLPHQLALKEVKRAKHLNPVRTIALNMFKSKIILPLLTKLEVAFKQLIEGESGINRADTVARMLQMMLLLDMTPGVQEEAHHVQYQRITNLLQKHSQQKPPSSSTKKNTITI